ncbi:hypothetical protein WJX77_009548 [Trebouxia sp. C0004]
MVAWIYIEVLLYARHSEYPKLTRPPPNYKPVEQYYSGEALAAPLASVGLTAVAVWTAYRKVNGKPVFSQYDIWVPLALGFQGAAMSVFAKVPRTIEEATRAWSPPPTPIQGGPIQDAT